jgi:3-carboxy-cis,cis-muconate cycloisomerase
MIWRRGVDGASGALTCILEDGLPLQYAGPIGDLDILGDKADAVCLALAEKLGLNHYGGSWQVERSPITDIANMLTRITTATAKIGSDICLMVQDGIDHVKLDGGKSSSMPHKINPVNAELLISLARHNATLLGGVGQASLHENERSGAGWTLEWITLPQMLFATGASLNASLRLLHSIRKVGLKSEL